jgi:hypothetical protein
LGISAYFNLARSFDPPSPDSLLAMWQEGRYTRIEPFQRAWGKPLMFTEVGYRSTPGAATRPWDAGLDNGVDLTLQADLYQALFEYWRDVTWLKGLYLWYWSTDSDPAGQFDPGYSPQGKTAELIVSQWYGGTVPMTPGPYSLSPPTPVS